jgi:YidC/Oxa1 family membrane protein insertase
MKRAQGIVPENEVNVKTMPAYKDSLLTEARLASESFYKLANDKVEIEFTTRGAQPYSVKINDYMTYDSTALYLIEKGASQYGISLYAGENINTKDFVFQVAEHTDSTLVMQLPFAGGGYIQQRFFLPADSYMMQNELSLVNMDGIIPRNVSMLDIDWSVVVPRLEKGYKNEKQYSNLDYYFTGDKKPENMGRGRDGSERIDTKLKWFAFQQQFFSAIMTAKNEFASADLSLKFFSESEYKNEDKLMACSAKLRSDFQAGSDNVTIPYEF